MGDLVGDYHQHPLGQFARDFIADQQQVGSEGDKPRILHRPESKLGHGDEIEFAKWIIEVEIRFQRIKYGGCLACHKPDLVSISSPSIGARSSGPTA